MSFGFSAGDIRAALELALFLHEKCFTKAQGADVLYLRFGKDIGSLAENLHQLDAVINHANSQRPRRPWRNHDVECRTTLQPLSEATGDFRQTLEECQKLLKNNERFQRDSAGFVANVQWHMGTQRDVEILRERVHFHATKLIIILRPFEIQLLLEIQRELQVLRREVAEIKGLLVTLLANGTLTDLPYLIGQTVHFPDIAEEIVDKFLNAVRQNAPETFHDVADLPLREGFDALVHHFAQSTVEFNPGSDLSQRVPTETQFINLLKSRWILEKLEGSSQLEAAGSDSMWASYLWELKSDIIKEYKRFDSKQLVEPSKDTMYRAPNECFSIWVVETQLVHAPDLAEQRPLEEQILGLLLPESIGTRKTFLNVFERSAIEFRFVTTTKDLANPAYHKERDFIVNTDVTRIIPAYAIPEGDTNSNNLLLSGTHIQDLRWQCLTSWEDVATLQQALTGYRVHHNMKNVSWSLNGSGKPGKSGKGRLQMWQLQHLPHIVEISDKGTSPSNLSITSPQSIFGSHDRRKLSTNASSTQTMFSGSSTTSIVAGSRGNGTAVLLPEPPVMVLFTMHEGKYAFLHLELNTQNSVNPELCHCRKNSKRECHTVVIESRKKRMEIRRHCAKQTSESGLWTWDLAPFRIPRHPEYRSVEVLPKAKFLTLDFQTVAEKDEFCAELSLLERVRNLEKKRYDDILLEKEQKARRPGRK